MVKKKTPEEFLEEARKMIGKETATATARYDVEYEPIRRYSRMVDDAKPLYNSPQFAKKTKYGDVLMPPFAPFGIMPDQTSAPEILPPRPGPFLINMAQEWEWMKPIKVGDRLSYKFRLADVYIKKIKIDPKALWIVFEMEVTNQHGEIVCMIQNILLTHRSPEQVAEDAGQ